MIHYTCDRCRKIIETENETRYIVRIEVQANSCESESMTCNDEADHLMAIEDIIQRLEDPEYSEDIPEDLLRRREFDLCSNCYMAYLQNPLASDEPQAQLGFSNN